MAKKRNIRVHGVRRQEPDVRKLSRALIALAEAQREVDAAAAHHAPKAAAVPRLRPHKGTRSDRS
jgi:hypothetical protein